jgi:hypothetical protein
MCKRSLQFISIPFLIVAFMLIVPGTVFASASSHNSSIEGTGSPQGTPVAGAGGGIQEPAPSGAGGAVGGETQGPASSGAVGATGGETQGPASAGAGGAVGGGVQGPASSGGTSIGTQAGRVVSVGQYGCYGASCNNQDPGAMGCNRSRMTFVPFNVVDAVGDVLATGQNVYSVGCKANWTEGTLTGVGRNIIVLISTVSSQGNGPDNCFPHNPGGSSSFNCDLAGYNGATGWPAFGDMVDGTSLTRSVIQATGPDGRVYLNSVKQ